MSAPCGCQGKQHCVRCVPLHPNYVRLACNCTSYYRCHFCSRWLRESDAVATVRRVFPGAHITKTSAGDRPVRKEGTT